MILIRLVETGQGIVGFIFFFQKCDQGAPLRKMHIKGNLAKYMNFERLYKSRLIVRDRIILWGKKGGSRPKNAPVYASCM